MGKAETPSDDIHSEPLDAERLIRDHQRGIWRYLRVLGCDPALADDLTQETFLSVLQRKFEDYSPAATRSYLKRTAFNAFISLKRREGKVVAVENVELLGEAWNDLVRDDDGDELKSLLEGCLAELSQRAHWAMQMRYRDQLSRVEIASHLKITEHGARNLMQRAKQQLRECMELKLKQNDQ
jgi:RNA polymerase sigma-70 factor (ECF subfamily)